MALASTVLPVPGTSSISRWPWHSSATRASRTSSCLPTMTRSTLAMTRSPDSWMVIGTRVLLGAARWRAPAAGAGPGDASAQMVRPTRRVRAVARGVRSGRERSSQARHQPAAHAAPRGRAPAPPFSTTTATAMRGSLGRREADEPASAARARRRAPRCRSCRPWARPGTLAPPAIRPPELALDGLLHRLARSTPPCPAIEDPAPDLRRDPVWTRAVARQRSPSTSVRRASARRRSAMVAATSAIWSGVDQRLAPARRPHSPARRRSAKPSQRTVAGGDLAGDGGQRRRGSARPKPRRARPGAGTARAPMSRPACANQMLQETSDRLRRGRAGRPVCGWCRVADPEAVDQEARPLLGAAGRDRRVCGVMAPDPRPATAVTILNTDPGT